MSRRRVSNGSQLAEPDWILGSPYGAERRGGVTRVLKNRAVLDDVVAPISSLPLDHYFQIVLTNEASCPFENADESLLPQFYVPEVQGVSINYRDQWSDLQSHVGWVNYDILRNVADSACKDHDSYYAATFEVNQQNMASTEPEEVVLENLPEPSTGKLTGKRGVRLIYSPRISKSSFLHFSWKNESSAIRDYSKSGEVAPIENRGYSKSDVEERIEICVEVPSCKPITDVGFWHQKTIELNGSHLNQS